MANLNRFKFTFGKKSLTLTSENDRSFVGSQLFVNSTQP